MPNCGEIQNSLELGFDKQLKRTLAVVHRMAEGEHLVLPSGLTIGMAEDMTIGYMVQYPDGIWRISALSTIDLKQLNDELNNCPFPYFPTATKMLK